MEQNQYLLVECDCGSYVSNQNMKQTFTQIFAVLYLISSIGFGGVQQYCNNAQMIMHTGETHCCSEEESAPKEVETSACCSMETSGPTLVQSEMSWNDGCCDFKQVYHQVDSSPTPHQDNLVQNGKAFCVLGTSALGHNNAPIAGSIFYTHPATHLNTPLLI